MIKIGDFVTAYGTGYWQLIDIKPKIAFEDYNGENVTYKKGDVIGQWVILKKAFTAKMKPRIDFIYEDSSWLRPVSSEVLCEISKYFDEHPDYKEKFENAEIRLRPSITNCWFDLPEEKEGEFRSLLAGVPSRYTMDEFWAIATEYKKYISVPPTKYLLNFETYEWDMDENFNSIYSGCELRKMKGE